MTQRYFITPPGDSPTATLDASEAQHLLRVMRGRVGDEVTLFDGQGMEYRARVTGLAKTAAELQILDRCSVDRELPGCLTIGVALPRGDRQRWLIEKCVELGVHVIQPLSSRRGVAQPTPSAIERLRRAVIEASKQCGRNRLMQVRQPLAFQEYLTAAPAAASRLIADPSGNRCTLAQLSGPTVHLLIGPEGGWTDEERQQATAADWLPIGLGPRILRVETATVALASAFAFLRGET